jgi:RND family efflux transporter MFP subunit
MRRSPFTVAVGLLLVLTPVALAQPQGPPPANVVLDAVRAEVVEQQRAATGQILTRRRSSLAAEEAGLVAVLDLEAGDLVERGQIVAQLDPTYVEIDLTRARAQVALAEAFIAQRRAELDQSQRDLERLLQLDARGSASESELDDGRTRVAADRATLAQAEADLAIARADVASAEARLEDMTIRAPFSGRVVRKATEVGQWASRGDPIVEIVSVRSLEARVDVPENVVGRVGELLAAKGELMIDVRVPALGAYVPGRVISIIPQGDQLSRLFPVRLELDNPDELMKPGMSVVAMMPTRVRAETTTVHKDAILRNDVGEYVYFDADGMAMVAPIERLFAVGDRIAIRAGMLRPGMDVVVEGNERLFPTQPLNVLGRLGDAQAPAPDAGHAQTDTPAEGG